MSSSMDPMSLLFHLIDHQLKEEGLHISREQLAISKQQLVLAYQRLGMDAEKLRLYQERNAMELQRFKQQQASYLDDLFRVYDDVKRANTLRFFTDDEAFAYLMTWLMISETLPCSVEHVPLLMLLPAAQKRALVEAYLNNSLHEAIPHAVQLALEEEAKGKEKALPLDNKVSNDFERHVQVFHRRYKHPGRWSSVRVKISFLPASAGVIPKSDYWFFFKSEFGEGWHRVDKLATFFSPPGVYIEPSKNWFV